MEETALHSLSDGSFNHLTRDFYIAPGCSNRGDRAVLEDDKPTGKHLRGCDFAHTSRICPPTSSCIDCIALIAIGQFQPLAVLLDVIGTGKQLSSAIVNH